MNCLTVSCGIEASKMLGTADMGVDDENGGGRIGGSATCMVVKNVDGVTFRPDDRYGMGPEAS